MANSTERATNALREAILSGHWKPGIRLQPGALSKEFGTSSTVIREALTRLSGGGLVKAEANRGFFVKELDLQSLQDVTELRVRTESFAAELAIARGDVEWESEVVAAHYRLSRVSRRDDQDPRKVSLEWQRLHKDFHYKVIAACDCEPILNLAADLYDSTEFYRCWVAQIVAPDSRDVEGEHQRIVDAILARDAVAAGDALRAHYESTVNVILESGVEQ